MNDLPAGWARVSVDDLAAVEPRSITDGPFGSNLKTSHYQEAGPRVIRLQNIGEGRFNDERAHISEEHFATLSQHEAKAGDVLVAMLGEKLPRACLVPPSLGAAIVKADCARIRVNPNLAYAPFVSHALNSEPVRRVAADLIHGVGRPRLGLNLLRTVEVPLAPLVEQNRVVDSLESLLSRLDETTALLDRVQRNLKRYRASVLKAAVEGRLVPTEAELARAEKRDYEPASVLLKRILVERRRRWEAEGKRGKYEEQEAPDTNRLPGVPEGWCWATVEQLASDELRSIQSGPFGSNLRHTEFQETGRLVIGIDNVQDGFFSAGSNHRISENKFKELKKYQARPGDVLITVMATIGRCCVVPDDIEPAIITKHVYRIGVERRFVLPRYLHVALWGAPAVREQMFGQVQGQTRPGLNGTIIRRLAIPIPPVAEQDRILQRVDLLLSVCQEADHSLVAIAQRCARLRQSILKWAFEGKLVDQDPDDEPASALLARIRAERGAGATGRPASRRARTRDSR